MVTTISLNVSKCNVMSVRLTQVLCLNECTFVTLVEASFYFSEHHRRYKNSKGKRGPGVKCTGLGKTCQFRRGRRLFRERHEVGP